MQAISRKDPIGCSSPRPPLRRSMVNNRKSSGFLGVAQRAYGVHETYRLARFASPACGVETSEARS